MLPLLVLLPFAAAPDRLLVQAQEFSEQLENEKALALLDKALASELSPPERQTALALRAEILVSYGCDARAVDAFHGLLTHDLRFEPPAGASPKIGDCLKVARSSFDPWLARHPLSTRLFRSNVTRITAVLFGTAALALAVLQWQRGEERFAQAKDAPDAMEVTRRVQQANDLRIQSYALSGVSGVGAVFSLTALFWP